jgi:hypothetical protein
MRMNLSGYYSRRYKMIPNATILDGNSRRYENRIVATITDQPRIVAELQASTRLPSADEPRTERLPKQTVLCLVVDCWLLCTADRDRPLESWSWNSNLGCKPHRNKRLGTSFVNETDRMQGNGAEESFWRRVSGKADPVQLFIQSERLFLFFGNHWYIQALGNSRNTFNTGKTVRGFEKKSWLPNQFVKINEQSSLPATGYTQDKGSMTFLILTELRVYHDEVEFTS